MCDAIGCAASGESSVDRPGASSSAGTTTDDRPTTVRPSGRFFPLWRPQSAMLHCRRPALARQAPLVARAAAGSSSLPSADKLRSAILREPWDSSPRPWRLFWAVKLSAAVLESDAAAQSLRLLPVESVGLSPPASLDDARRRAATNLVVFRQNYLAAGLLAAAACATRHAALLCGCALLLLAAVCSSDRLLGEVSLATDGQLIWNANRVGGLDRTLSVRAAWAAAGACFALVPLHSAGWLLRSLCLLSLFVAVHAVTRPVDLQASLASFWSDVTSSTSREEVAASFTDAADRVSSWWRGREKGPVPVVVVEVSRPAPGTGGRGAGAWPGGAGRDAPPPLPPQGRLPGK